MGADQITDLHTLLASQLPADLVAWDAFALNDSGEFIVAAENNTTFANSYYVAKPLIPTHTTITSNINPSTYGQQIHLVAKVTPDSGPVPTTGSVSWYDNGTLVGYRTDDNHRYFELGTLDLDRWSHNVTAMFPANTTLGSSTAPVFKQTVNAASTRTTVSASPSPATHGQPVKLTATGSHVGNNRRYGYLQIRQCCFGNGTMDARTKQTWLTTSFAKGRYSITASFAGSQNFVASSSSAVALTVK